MTPKTALITGVTGQDGAYLSEFPFKQECYDIVGCCMEVHKTLGHGFLEADYQEALTYEFANQQIPYYKEKVLNIL